MADKKISQLSSASTPLSGSEVLPIVQSSATVKVATDDLTVKNFRSNATSGILQTAGVSAGATRTMTVPDANFTAARTDAAQTLTGNQTISAGNLVVGTAGKGIDFSAATHAAGRSSALLDDYETGTFTPTYLGSSSNPTITYYVQQAVYTKVGNFVFWTAEIWTNAVSGGSGTLQLGGLPFTAMTARYVGTANVGYAYYFTTQQPTTGTIFQGATNADLYYAAAGGFTAVPVSYLTNGSSKNIMTISGCYLAA